MDTFRFCVICLEAEENLDFQWHGCPHKFHEKCASEWMKVSATCPICRTHNGEERNDLFTELNFYQFDDDSLYTYSEPEYDDDQMSFYSEPEMFDDRCNLYKYDESEISDDDFYCDFCDTEVVYGFRYCENCFDMVQESGQMSSAPNPLLNKNSNYNFDRITCQIEPARILQRGNYCSSCFKTLPFSMETLRFEEICDECQQKYKYTEPTHNQFPKESDEHFGQNLPSFYQTCEQRWELLKRWKKWQENDNIIHQLQPELVDRLTFEDSQNKLDEINNGQITEEQKFRRNENIREHQYKNSHKTLRMRELENLESPPGFENMKRDLIREQLKIDFIFFPAPPGFSKPEDNFLKRIDESEESNI
jgi:hypothetical protein